MKELRCLTNPINRGSGGANHHIKMDNDEHGLTLRAGSRRHQHIVAFDKDDAASASGPTKFTLIALDLPAETWKKGRETD